MCHEGTCWILLLKGPHSYRLFDSCNYKDVIGNKESKRNHYPTFLLSSRENFSSAMFHRLRMCRCRRKARNDMWFMLLLRQKTKFTVLFQILCSRFIMELLGLVRHGTQSLSASKKGSSSQLLIVKVHKNTLSAGFFIARFFIRICC